MEPFWKVTNRSFYLSIWSDSISFRILLESIGMKGTGLLKLSTFSAGRDSENIKPSCYK